MGKFSLYPVASSVDYADATTFLIQNSDGETKLASLSGLGTNYFCSTYCASLTIASADVLQLNSTPLEIVAAPGVGYAIEVLSASVAIDFNSAAYATNTTLQLITSGAGTAQVQGGLLGATVSKVGRLATINTPTAGNTQVIENAALNVTVATGDPITGDSDITVYITYREIEL